MLIFCDTGRGLNQRLKVLPHVGMFAAERLIDVLTDLRSVSKFVEVSPA